MLLPTIYFKGRVLFQPRLISYGFILNLMYVSSLQAHDNTYFTCCKESLSHFHKLPKQIIKYFFQRDVESVGVKRNDDWKLREARES